MLWENHIPIKLRKREREIHKHWQDSMDNVISLQPLDGTLAHNYSPRCHFIGMGDRYSAKTTGTGTNQVLHGRRVSATEDRCDLVFFTWKQGKPLHAVVRFHLCGVLWLWQEGWEEAERAFTACVWRVRLSAHLPLPAPPYPSEQRAPTVMHTRRNCTPSNRHLETLQTWVTVFTEDTDLIACTLIIWVFLIPPPPAGVTHEMRASAGAQSRPHLTSLNHSVLWGSLHPQRLNTTACLHCAFKQEGPKLKKLGLK